MWFTIVNNFLLRKEYRGKWNPPLSMVFALRSFPWIIERTVYFHCQKNLLSAQLVPILWPRYCTSLYWEQITNLLESIMVGKIHKHVNLIHLDIHYSMATARWKREQSVDLELDLIINFNICNKSHSWIVCQVRGMKEAWSGAKTDFMPLSDIWGISVLIIHHPLPSESTAELCLITPLNSTTSHR